MSQYKVEALPVPLTQLGEGPYWDANSQELLYVDIFGKSVHRYNLLTEEERRMVIEDNSGERPVGAALSFVIPVQSEPDTFLIAYNGDIKVLKWPAGQENVQKLNIDQLKTLYSTPAHDPPRTVNDAKCDDKGRLWTGTLCISKFSDEFKIADGLVLITWYTTGLFSAAYNGSLLDWKIINGACHFYRLDTDGKLTTFDFQFYDAVFLKNA